MHNSNWNKSTGSSLYDEIFHEDKSMKCQEWGDRRAGQFSQPCFSRLRPPSGANTAIDILTISLAISKCFSSRIHKNAAGVNGLKPPVLHRVWQFIIQQGFSLTQFGFFLFVNNRVFRAVCGFRLSPSLAKLYSQMHQYLLGNRIHWQKKLFAFPEDQVEWSGNERWKYLDSKAEKKLLVVVATCSPRPHDWLSLRVTVSESLQ